jgi:hypothetical protein
VQNHHHHNPCCKYSEKFDINLLLQGGFYKPKEDVPFEIARPLLRQCHKLFFYYFLFENLSVRCFDNSEVNTVRKSAYVQINKAVSRAGQARASGHVSYLVREKSGAAENNRLAVVVGAY